MNYQDRLFRQRCGYGCEPATILLVSSLAISALGTTAQIQGQKAQAKAQTAEQQQLVAANNEVVNQEQSTLREQEAQAKESVARENFKAQLTNDRAKSTATVAAGEAGVSGSSVTALLNEYDMHLGQFREATNRQGTLTSQGVTQQLQAIGKGAMFQNLQINAPVSQPQYGAAAISFAGDALSAYRAYNPSAFKQPKAVK